MRRLLVGCVALATVGMIASIASASPVSVGSPSVTGSWSMQWHDPESFSYDMIAVRTVSGDLLEHPAFTVGSDATTLDNGTSFHGPATIAIAINSSPATDMYWTQNYMGASGSPIVYDWYVFEPGHNVASAAYVVSNSVNEGYDAGSGWSYNNIAPTLTRSDALAAVPLPAAAWLGLSMLTGMGLFAKLRKRKHMAL